MIHLEHIVLREIRMPLRVPFRTATGVQADRRILLVEAVDGDGFTAWSECVAQETPHYLPETIDTAWHALRAWLLPRVLGRGFARPEDLAPALGEGVRGHRMAKAAVEMAAWAVAAEKEGVALAALLGGTRRQVAAGVALGLQPDPEALVEKVRAARAAGYRKVKLKVRPGADVAFVRAVREAVGPDAPLAVDANGTYTLDDLDALRALDGFGLTMIEQPLAWDDLVQHATLQRALRTPVCLDESLPSAARVRDMLALDSGRVVNVKPGRVGGLAEAKAVHDLCRAHDVPAWCGGMLESGIGRAYNVALAALPGFTLPGDLSPSRRYWERDVVTPEWTMDADGFVTVPFDRPGLGVDVDRDRVEDLTVRALTL